jgi:hypothetical protein
MNSETYFRKGAVAFTVLATNWPEAEAAERATDYLANYVSSLPMPGVRLLHSALLHERQHPEKTPPYNYGEAIREVRDRENRAVLFAVADWLQMPTTGHAVKLLPAGDATEGGE